VSARPDFVVVTGLSGAGKSQAVKVFEDLGYYILDNLPPAIMGTTLDVARKGGHPRVAMVIDSRSGALFADAAAQLELLERAGTRPHLLFFDASDEVLLRRYSETRHRHPLETTGGVQPSIEEERRLLVDVRARRARATAAELLLDDALSRLNTPMTLLAGSRPTRTLSSLTSAPSTTP